MQNYKLNYSDGNQKIIQFSHSQCQFSPTSWIFWCILLQFRIPKCWCLNKISMISPRPWWKMKKIPNSRQLPVPRRRWPNTFRPIRKIFFETRWFAKLPCTPRLNAKMFSRTQDEQQTYSFLAPSFGVIFILENILVS